MNPRDTIAFLRSPTGVFVSFGLLLIAALVFVRGFDHSKSKPKAAPQTASETKDKKPQLLESIQKEMVPFHPPPSGQTNPTAFSESEKKTQLAPISLFSARETEPKQISPYYAPYGRLIPCELVITVDSSSIHTPIIGLVTEDIYHRGRLIIPARTEVHGTAQTDRTRERIASGTDWTLVWQSGEELSVRGLALDREKDEDNQGWSIADGSAGLRGRILKSDDMAEIKLFAATFLRGAASALTERQQTIFGSQELPSLQNAPLKGAQDVLGVYAKQILDSIQRDGFYVRVPAGKQFYLYVLQTIDQSDASIGGTRLSNPETNSFDSLPNHPDTVRSAAPDRNYPTQSRSTQQVLPNVRQRFPQ